MWTTFQVDPQGLISDMVMAYLSHINRLFALVKSLFDNAEDKQNVQEQEHATPKVAYRVIKYVLFETSPLLLVHVVSPLFFPLKRL
jgi:hypothetical protein